MNPRYRNLKDEELVKEALNAPEAFGELMIRYEERLKRYIIRLSGVCTQSAEDILQESFLKAWKSLQSFSEGAKWSTWIYRITHNETISFFRKKKSRGEDKGVENMEDVFNIIPFEEDFREELEKKLDAKAVKKILENLPEKYKEVIVLRYFEEKNYDEISDILRVSIGTVGTLLNRAKEKFKEVSKTKNIKFSYHE